MLISDFLRKILQQQPAMEDFLPPLAQHVTPETVYYKSGHVGFVIRVEGIPFDGMEDKHLWNYYINLCNTLSGIGKTLGDNLALWTTLMRKRISFERNYRFKTQFTKDFAAHYLERFNTGKYFENTFYITALIKGSDLDWAVETAEEISSVLMKSLQPYEPHLLTAYRNKEGILFSEVYAFFASLINGFDEPVPLSVTEARQTIGNADLHFGNDIAEVRNAQGVKYFQSYDLKDFGISRPKIFVDVLKLPFEFTLTQSFVYIDTSDIQAIINKQLNNLQSVGDQAIEQQEELLYGQGAVSSGSLMFGEYHGALIVYGDTPRETQNNASNAYTTFMNSGGFRFTKAGLSAPATYFSQVPLSAQKPRCYPKTTENLACVFGMHNYSHGKKWGNPIGDGSAIMPLQTVSNTVYDFNFHFSKDGEDSLGEKIAGHTLILGATGTGKTTLQTALLSFAERFDPYLFAADVDRGMEIFIRALGGSYFPFEAGIDTGLNPFQLADTPQNREFLYTLVGICGKNRNGVLTAEEEKQIQFAVDSTLSLNYGLRNFSNLLQSIPYKPEDPDSLRVRLSKWCKSEGGRFAWCLDNAHNKFDPYSFYRIGFDLTDILKDDYPPTEPVMAYLFHLRNLMMERVAEQNGILCSVFEEFWRPLRFPVMQEMMLKILKTDRKLGGWALLVSQSPEDAVQSEIFPAIVQQTPTKVFLPNPDAEWEGYRRCGLTQKEFRQLSQLALESRIFLVKQSKQSAFAKLDLHGFDDEMPVLSGSSNNLVLLRQIMEEGQTEDPAYWYPRLIGRIREKRRNKTAAAESAALQPT